MRREPWYDIILRLAASKTHAPSTDRIYSATRMDTAWAFRQAYEQARKIKAAQDEFCDKATRGDWAGLGDYPEDLQWEALVDVLRGRVKVPCFTHCHWS